MARPAIPDGLGFADAPVEGVLRFVSVDLRPIGKPTPNSRSELAQLLTLGSGRHRAPARVARPPRGGMSAGRRQAARADVPGRRARQRLARSWGGGQPLPRPAAGGKCRRGSLPPASVSPPPTRQPGARRGGAITGGTRARRGCASGLDETLAGATDSAPIARPGPRA